MEHEEWREWKFYAREEDAFPIFVEDGQLCFIINRGKGDGEYIIRYTKEITERIRKVLLGGEDE